MDFDELLDRYEKPVYNLIYRLVGDRDEAADLTQETFVSAFRSMHAFRGDAAEYTWLYRIAVNKCKNKFKNEDRRRNYEAMSLDASPADIGIASLAAPAEAPAEILERKERKRAIARAISQLPPDYRIVSVLRDMHGLSYSEIAEVAGLSVDVVRTRLARARGMLRQKLAHLFRRVATTMRRERQGETIPGVKPFEFPLHAWRLLPAREGMVCICPA